MFNNIVILKVITDYIDDSGRFERNISFAMADFRLFPLYGEAGKELPLITDFR